MRWLLPLLLSGPLAAGSLPAFDHVVIAIEENHSFSEIYQSASAPYINSLAAQGALFTQSFALTHPSEPNYLDLFSGSTQGVTDDSTPAAPFTTPNLGGLLIGAGYTFGGYSEDLPSVGFTGDDSGTSGGYQRKHNPWVDFADVPSSDNLPFTSFPSNFNLLPTVSFVVPDQDHDMHNGTIAMADTWLQNNLDPYIQWSKAHNSLFILTFDEDDSGQGNQIFTLFGGANVQTGLYSGPIDHFDVLRTVEDIYGSGYAGASANATAQSQVFNNTPEPASACLLWLAMAAVVYFGHRCGRSRTRVNATALALRR